MNSYNREKYCSLIDGLTESDIDRANKALISYMHTFDTRNAKRAVLDNWDVLYTLYGNIDNAMCTYRGEKFLYKNRMYGYELLKQFASNKVVYKDISSWTTSSDVAYRFAYYYVDGRKPLFDMDGPYTDNFVLSVVLAGVAQDGDGLDLTDISKLNSSFGQNEKEVIMPPGTFECKVASAAFMDNKYRQIFIYESPNLGNSKQDAKLSKALEKFCKVKNKELPRRAEYKYEVYYTQHLKVFIDNYEYLVLQ